MSQLVVCARLADAGSSDAAGGSMPMARLQSGDD
jgi:hypothetical protein